MLLLYSFIFSFLFTLSTLPLLRRPLNLITRFLEHIEENTPELYRRCKAETRSRQRVLGPILYIFLPFSIIREFFYYREKNPLSSHHSYRISCKIFFREKFFQKYLSDLVLRESSQLGNRRSTPPRHISPPTRALLLYYKDYSVIADLY